MLDVRPDQPLAGSGVSIPESTESTETGKAEPEKVDAAYVYKLIGQIESCDHDIEIADEQLKIAKEARRKLVEDVIPEVMDEVGMEEMKTREGDLLFIDAKTRCSIKAKKKLDALKWLDENGHGKMIKRQLVVDLGNDSIDVDKQCRGAINTQFLNKENPVPDMKTEKKVEPSTLTKFADGEMKAGRELPEDFFSVFTQRTAKVKVAKRDEI